MVARRPPPVFRGVNATLVEEVNDAWRKVKLLSIQDNSGAFIADNRQVEAEADEVVPHDRLFMGPQRRVRKQSVEPKVVQAVGEARYQSCDPRKLRTDEGFTIRCPVEVRTIIRRVACQIEQAVLGNAPGYSDPIAWMAGFGEF